MDISGFTGRHDELRRLHQLVGTIAGEPAGTMGSVVCTIEGMAGVGKTRLAIHAANQLARDGSFAEIQLWADLHGFDAGHAPADPAMVLETFLYALGVPGKQIPPDLDQRAGLYRDRLSGRRALVLLDNAASEDQVRPLLPGGPDCLVLITARRRLGDLDGAQSVALDVFSPVEAIDLLARIVGTGRVATDPDAAARIVRLCGYLPLAITLAARRLRSRTWRLAYLADRLQSNDYRLDQLNAGARGARTVFEQSYRALPAEQRRLFRLLGLHAGDDFTAHSASTIAGISPGQAELMLEALLDSYLLDQISPGRYRFHTLLRNYAQERVRDEDPPAQREC